MPLKCCTSLMEDDHIKIAPYTIAPAQPSEKSPTGPKGPLLFSQEPGPGASANSIGKPLSIEN